MKRKTKVAVRAAKEAGKILMEHFGRGMNIRNKGPKDLVTQADMESNKRIISILNETFPDYGILSEEIPEERGSSDCRWIIDPLDGTHNFIYGIPLFGTSIALEKDGRIVLGVISLPYEKRIFVAERGAGSFMNGKRIGVSKRGIKDAMVLLGGDKRNPENGESGLIRRLGKRVFELRMLGSAVIHHEYVATGRAEAYIQIRNKPWDNAAGFLLVEEAGGRVTDFSGRPWNINTTQFVVSNARVHEGILEVIRGPSHGCLQKACGRDPKEE